VSLRIFLSINLCAVVVSYFLVIIEMSADECWPDISMAVYLLVNAVVMQVVSSGLVWAVSRAYKLKLIAGVAFSLFAAFGAAALTVRAGAWLLVFLSSLVIEDKNYSCFTTLSSSYLNQRAGIFWVFIFCSLLPSVLYVFASNVKKWNE
jgi:hypothetical protein